MRRTVCRKRRRSRARKPNDKERLLERLYSGRSRKTMGSAESIWNEEGAQRWRALSKDFHLEGYDEQAPLFDDSPLDAPPGTPERTSQGNITGLARAGSTEMQSTPAKTRHNYEQL